MRFGVVLNQEEAPDIGTPRWVDIRAMAVGAEAIGLDSVWLVDHFVWRGDPWGRDPDTSRDFGVWESWTTLAALAEATGSLQLGTLVTCTGHRNPTLLAKMAATVEEISGGRLILGLGAGDSAEEHERFGFRYERRFDRFEEALAIIRPLLRGERVDHEGEFYSARDCVLLPRGPRPAGPPILVGSLAHAPRMLRLTARHADIWNGWVLTDELAKTHAALDEACQALGRDPSTLRRTVSVPIAFEGPMVGRPRVLSGSPSEIAEQLRSLDDGRLEAIQLIPFPNHPRSLGSLEDVLRALNA